MAEPRSLPAVRPVYDAGQTTAVAVADAWTDERREFVRRNFCGGAPVEVADLAMRLWERRGLSPEEGHVSLVPFGGKYQSVTRIDGYRTLAARTREYCGSDEPVFDGIVAPATGKAHPTKATVTVWRLIQGVRCPFTASALWDEFSVTSGQWPKMPFHMLAKVAESHALRKAFPVELAGIYTDDEMDQAGAIETTAREVPTVRERPSETAAADDSLDWTGFWRWAKAQGLDKAAIERVTQRPMTEFAPATVKQMMQNTTLADRPTASPPAATANGKAKADPRQTASEALHAHVRDRMKRSPEDKPDAHAGVKALQVYLYEDDPALRDASLTDAAVWTEEELRRFRAQVTTMDASDFAMIVTSEDDPPGTIEVDGAEVDAETGEIMTDPMGEFDRLARIAEAAKTCRSGEAWKALAAEVGADEAGWLALIPETMSPATIDLLRKEARRLKANTEAVERALNERRKAIQAAIQAHTP